jgi:hypothetical protein
MWMNVGNHNFSEDHIIVENQFTYSQIDEFICLGIYTIAYKNTFSILGSNFD